MRKREPRLTRVRFRNDVRAYIDGRQLGFIKDISHDGCLIASASWMAVDKKKSHALTLELPRSNSIVLNGTIMRSRIASETTSDQVMYEIGFKFNLDSDEFRRYTNWLKIMTQGTEQGQVKVFVSDDQIAVSRLLEQIDRITKQ